LREIEREDREEPITHNNRLVEREIGGLGGKLGAGEKREEGAGREIGGHGQGKEREERGEQTRGIRLGEKREEGAPLKLLATPTPGAALSEVSPCNPP
jgi:hypothetical protein